MAYAWHHVKVSMQFEMSAMKMIIAYCFLYLTCCHAYSVDSRQESFHFTKPEHLCLLKLRCFFSRIHTIDANRFRLLN